MPAALSASRGFAAPAFELPVDGDGAGLLAGVERVIGSEASGPKDVADAAAALAYLGAKGNRRLWGKVLEKASAVKGGFDAASLSGLMWALTAANVGHFRSVAELAGPAAGLLKTFTPAQLSLVVEGLAKSGVADAELFGKVTEAVAAKAADFKAADLARLLWAYGAAGVQDGAFVKAAGAGLAAKSAELTGRSAAQALWGLAALRRVPDAPLAGALTKALKGFEAPADAAAAAWALATLGLKADTKAIADALKAGAKDLTATQAIQGAWGLALAGGDAAAVGALLADAGAAIQKAPDSFSPSALALAHVASVVSGAALPGPVGEFAAKGFGLASEHARHARSSKAAAFHAELAEAVAYAQGARSRPDVDAKVAALTGAAPDGSTLDIVDASSKLVVVGVEEEALAVNTKAVLGGGLSVAKAREAQGYKVALVAAGPGWPAGQPAKVRAAAVLAAVKASVPSMASSVDQLSKAL